MEPSQNRGEADHRLAAQHVFRVVGAIRRLNRAMHWIAGAGLLVILGLTVADITGRSLFSSPVPGTVEVTSLVLVIVVFFGVAYSEDLGDHIAVDLIYLRASKRWKAVMDVITDVMSVVVLGLLAYQLYQFAQRQLSAGATTPVLRWPIWPFVLLGALGALAYAVAVLVKLPLRAMGEPTEAKDRIGEASGIEI